MSRTVLNRAHWPLWGTYAEVSEEARGLADSLQHPIVFKRWEDGWVIRNYKNFDRERCKQQAEDNGCRKDHDLSHDEFSTGWYLWRYPEKLPEGAYERGEGYW